MTEREQAIACIDSAVLGDAAVARGVAQRYLAYLQGVPTHTFWSSVAPTERCGVRAADGTTWSLHFDLVPFDHYCSAPCNATVRDIMTRMMRSLNASVAFALAELDSPRPDEGSWSPGRVPRPELFLGASIQLTPSDTVFLYNAAHGDEMYKTLSTKIGFIWERVAVPCDTEE